MSKALLEKIEKDEESRISDISKRFEEKEPIDISQILGNETTVKELVNGTRVWTGSFSEAIASLPLNTVIYSKILVTACPQCLCSSQPDLIKPYLERGLVIPILSNSLTEYPEKFANLVIQYPYIGSQAAGFLKYADSRSFHEPNDKCMCTKCYAKKCAAIIESLNKISKNVGLLREAKTACDLSFNWLYPARQPEVKLLDSIEDSVKSKKIKNLAPIAEQAWTLSNLRKAQAFRAVPQVDLNDLQNISETLRLQYSLKTNNNEDEKWLVLKALNLDYDPAMNVEEYLDIIMPRRKRINSLIEEIISSDGKGKNNLSTIQSDIVKINSEISRSKKLETFTWGTSIVFNNPQIFSSVLAGALIGYASGNFPGCGVGSAGGLALGGLSQWFLGKYGKFKVTKYPVKTTEWVKSRMEGVGERVLATILAKDIKAVQVWSLRKRLKK